MLKTQGGDNTMKIRQVRGYNLLTEAVRKHLESVVYSNMESASRELQQALPNHVVITEPGRISVFVKDRSFHVAQFEPVKENTKMLSYLIDLEKIKR
jgi:hypothetical protein